MSCNHLAAKGSESKESDICFARQPITALAAGPISIIGHIDKPTVGFVVGRYAQETWIGERDLCSFC